MKHLLLSVPVLAAVLLFAPPAAAQTGLFEQPSELLRTGAGDMYLRFYGYAGRTYFIQVSDPNDPLVTWHWAPVIEPGNDEFISYEVGGTSPHGFFRLQYTDEVPPPGVSLEDWDLDDDGISNIDEIENQLGSTNPMDADTDGDGTNDGGDSAPNDAGGGGTAIRGEIESRWNLFSGGNDILVSGNHIAVHTGASGTDSIGGESVTAQEGYEALTEAANFAAVATAGSSFALPGSWENKMRGMEWSNLEEQPHDWNKDPLEFPDIPYMRWRAGRLEHRMRLNKKAPADGYEVPFQVLKLHWKRNAPEGSAWTADAAGNVSIIKKFMFAKGEILSEAASYDPIAAVASNRAVTLHSIRFVETEPESGYDDHVRHVPGQRFELPWLAVAGSTTAETTPNATVKLHFAPSDWPLQLTVDVPAGHTGTVTPNTVSGDQPVVLTIGGSNSFGQNENSYEGTLNIEGVPVLNLAFYKRREVKLAVHEITLINDDVETEYVKINGQPAEPIAMGEGKPNTTCIGKGTNNIADTQEVGGDDERWLGGTVRTGPNGICETTAAVGDEQIIPVGKGEPGATIVEAGPNNELNTGPNAPDSNIQAGSQVVNIQDDAVVGTTITTGPDGLRQTPVPRPRQEPVNVPAQAELQEFLDLSYGRQANIWFKIVGWNQADAAFDVASMLPGDLSYATLKAPNHRFDFFTVQEDSNGLSLETREEQLVKVASYNSGAGVMNLYFIGAQFRSSRSETSNSQPLGFARSLLRRPYISAFDSRKALADQSKTFQLSGAAAHELAHNDLINDNEAEGLHHPWTTLGKGATHPEAENGFIPFSPEKTFTLYDQQTDRLRLMWPGVADAPNAATSRYPAKLLKHEVDRLHEIGPP